MSMLMKKYKYNESQENVFWTTMSDLMLGLAIIFITLFVLTITGFTQNEISQKQKQIEISKELIEKLKQADIDAQVDPLTGDIKISDLELFEVGSYNLSAKGKLYLNKLVPIYINTIFSKPEFIDQIENIVIQGHTDSQTFAGIKNPDVQYLKNMTLSLERANSVANYIFYTNFDKQYNNQLKKILAVEGKSYSEPVLTDGEEDYAKSRRVEMRIKTKKPDITEVLFNGTKLQNN